MPSRSQKAIDRYAKALIDVVMAPGSKLDPKQALAELRAIQELIAGSTVLHNALLSPAVSPSRKRAVMGRLIEPMGVSRPVRNFAFVVIDHRRIHSLAAMVDPNEDTLRNAKVLVSALACSFTAPPAEDSGLSVKETTDRLFADMPHGRNLRY